MTTAQAQLEAIRTRLLAEGEKSLTAAERYRASRDGHTRQPRPRRAVTA